MKMLNASSILKQKAKIVLFYNKRKNCAELMEQKIAASSTCKRQNIRNPIATWSYDAMVLYV